LLLFLVVVVVMGLDALEEHPVSMERRIGRAVQWRV